MRAKLHQSLASALILLLTGIANAKAADLGGWMEDELIPYVASQLTGHPRFRGETVVIVALDAGAPAPVTNALALALRDRLVATLIDKPGIRIGWPAGGVTRGHKASAIDCGRDTVHYFIGLEVTPVISGEHRITLRVLDATDRSWVSGVGQTWQGRLSKAQRQAFEQVKTDEHFRGSREAPYSAAQADLLAARLAHELTCSLLRQVAGEYVIATAPPDATLPLPGALALVRNNLAGQASLQLAADSANANAQLSGKAHAIAGDLYQYWVTVTPIGDGEALPAVSASAYVRLPYSSATVMAQPTVPVTPVPAVTPSMPGSIALPAPMPGPAIQSGGQPAAVAMNTPARHLITPLRIVEPRQRRACYNRSASRQPQQLVSADFRVARGECFLLQTRAEGDVSVFLLNYQVIHGLVNLSGSRCSPSPHWLDARAGQALEFPSAGDVRPSASAWQGHAGLESFYAIAVSDPNAAREIGRYLDQLPARCSLSATQGLSGPPLQAWLAGLREITRRWPQAVDWQAVRIEHVY
jgi:hypothetical protein